MMNKFIKFIKRFVKFFDKKIITPVTKFFVWVTDKTKDLGVIFEKLFSKKSSLVIVSLIISIGIFYYVDTKSTTISETSAEVIYNQKINAIYNEEAYVVEGLPETVDITMIGRKSDLYLAKQLPVEAVDIDLKELKPGTHEVSLKYKGAINSVSYKIDPSIATVIIYSKMSEVRTLTYDIVNQDKLNSKLSISKVELDRKEVIIKGPQYKLDKVASVKALVDISKIEDPKVGTIELTDVQLVAYDMKGIIIDVEIVPSKVTATIEITSPYNDVDIKIVPTGKVAFGKAISSITSSVKTVRIYADQETLDKIGNIIEIPVNVDGLDSEKKQTLTIKKPSGVREISEVSTTVTVDVEKEVTKEIEDILLQWENLSENYSPNAASEADRYVTVVVRGVQSVINEITKDNINVYVDLKGYGPGTNDVDVIVTGKDEKGKDVRISYDSKVSKVTWIISKKR